APPPPPPHTGGRAGKKERARDAGGRFGASERRRCYGAQYTFRSVRRRRPRERPLLRIVKEKDPPARAVAQSRPAILRGGTCSGGRRSPSPPRSSGAFSRSPTPSS